MLPRQSRGGDAVGRLLQSAWRYKGLIVVAVLLGALVGYGWAARQPALYEGVTRIFPTAMGSGSLPGKASLPIGEPAQYVRKQAEVISSAVVLERAVKLSGSRISAETLGQRLEVDVAQDANVLTIRVVDSTATEAVRLADAVATAYDRVLVQQFNQAVRQLQNRQGALKARLAEAEAKLARNPNDLRLRANCEALTHQNREVLGQLMALERSRPSLVRERAAVPKQPITPGPGRPVAIGMLLGLLASVALAWWLGRPPGTLTLVAAGGR
jgi:capsular polysaccharide biosynthesis protein